MDFSSRNPATSNALNLAARNNDVHNVQRLIHKINPNCVDNRGWTCLHEAAHHDNYECMMLILENPQCRPLAETHEGHTALYLACRNKCSLKTIRGLLRAVDDIANYGSTEGVTPLHIASSQGRVELIELLLEYGAMIDAQDFDGDTPLHDAVLTLQHDSIVTLVYAGASVEIHNVPACFTPFHLACYKGYYPNMECLFPFVTDINQVTSLGHSPLSLAIQGLNFEIVNFLIENGADPHIKNANGDMAIDIAINIGFSDVFPKLLSITDRSKINKNIILNACKPHCLNFEILEILLSSDLGSEFFNFYEQFHDIEDDNVMMPSYRTNAPLNSYLDICGYIYRMSPEKFKEFFYLFLMRGVDVNAQEVFECPPLVYANYSNCFCFEEVFNILVTHGCNVDYCSSSKGVDLDNCMPDAFLVALSLYPFSVPIMMPYSFYCEPDRFLQFAAERGQLGMIPIQVQNELISMMYDNDLLNVTAECLKYHVPCLKHLCRKKIRNILITKDKKGQIKTTQESMKILHNLPLPPRIIKYLRYLCN